MKISIPEALKSELPQTFFGKVLGVTPVVMTVVATLLAGLASGEMTRAQYSRSLAAQQQSKAGDQWNFFQAKRLRSALQRSTHDLLQSTAPTRPIEKVALEAFPGGPALKTLLDSPPGHNASLALQSGRLPQTSITTELPKEVIAALKAVEESKPESEIANLVAPIDEASIDQLLRKAKDDVASRDASLSPINAAVDQIESLVAASEPEKSRTPSGFSLTRDVTAARLRYSIARYDTESRLNQTIANLHELQVRKSNLKAERHHRRSQRFFLGMLAAQAAVIIATFSLAARNKNVMWGIAAAAGLIAVGFAIYVFLYV